MINKIVDSVAEAVSPVTDGAVVMIGGFGEVGSPIELIHALIDQGTEDLTAINNNTGNGEVGLAALIGNRQVRKMTAAVGFPTLRLVRVRIADIHLGSLAAGEVMEVTDFFTEQIMGKGSGD